MRRSSIVLACLALGGIARADLLPPEKPGVPSRSLVVSDEADRRDDLRVMAAGAPTLLLPIFTRCGGTCPLAAVTLKEALAKATAPFRVVVVSFDPEDDAKDLSDFRERLELPATWLIVRSVDGAATRVFFDELGFHFMSANGGFDHPNETFVFSPRGAWAATFAGGTFPAGELEVAWRRAVAADDPSASWRLRAWLLRPEAWILLACAGLAISLLAVTHLVRRVRLAGRPTRGSAARSRP